MKKKYYYIATIAFMCFVLIIIILIIKEPKIYPQHQEKLSYSTILTFATQNIDLDTVYYQKENEIRIPYKNIGNNIFKIYRVSTSCCCTILKDSEKPLLPGETDTLKIVITPNDTGYIKETISLFGNNSDSIINIIISGYAKKY